MRRGFAVAVLVLVPTFGLGACGRGTRPTAMVVLRPTQPLAGLYIELRGDPGLVKFTARLWRRQRNNWARWWRPPVVAQTAHGPTRCSVSHTFHVNDVKGIAPGIVKHFPIIFNLEGQHLTMSVFGKNNPHATTLCGFFYGGFW